MRGEDLIIVNASARPPRLAGLPPGGKGIRHSGLVVRHIDSTRSAKYRFMNLLIPKINSLRRKIVFSAWHSEYENLLIFLII